MAGSGSVGGWLGRGGLLGILAVLHGCSTSGPVVLSPDPPDSGSSSVMVNTLSDGPPRADDQCTLREAMAANNNRRAENGCQDPQGQITFDPVLRGTITIQNSPLPQISKDLLILGPGSAQLTLSGNQTYRVLDIGSQLRVEIRGLTILNGQAASSGPDIDQAGGGIRAAASTTLTVNQVTLRDNRAGSSGGGIQGSEVIISNSLIMGNTANTGGGGGLAANSVSIVNSTVDSNVANTEGGGISAATVLVSDSSVSRNQAKRDGGGINAATATVKRTLIDRNLTSRQGGGLNASTQATISSSSFDRNTAAGNGGGIRASGLELSNSTLSSNSAYAGGGILSESTARVSNSTLSGNSAKSGGGMQIQFGASSTLLNSTLTGNIASTTGGGIRTDQRSRIAVGNSIISGNTAPGGPECQGLVTGDFNISGINSQAGGCPTGSNNFVPKESILTVLNPRLETNTTTVTLGDPNTGLVPVLTHALTPTSPARYQGSTTICLNAPINNLDQRGVNRVQTGSTTCDIGSFESDLPPPTRSLVVNTLNDEDPTGSNLRTCTLREAIIANNQASSFGGCQDPQGRITFDPNLRGTITIQNSPLPPISRDLVMVGLGSTTLAISGNQTFRVLDIGPNRRVEIQKLTITQGRALKGSETPDQSGAGIRAGSLATLILSDSLVSSHVAGANGGGIDAGLSGTVMVTNSTVSDNSANNQGGGIQAGSVFLSNSILKGNSSGSLGGGLFSDRALVVTNSTITGNRSALNGGGIRALGTASISNSLISDNRATSLGGGIHVDTATVSNSIFTGNQALRRGGAMYTFQDRSETITVNSSTLSDNEAGQGAGIHAHTAVVSNSTLSGNRANRGGGLYAYTATVRNSTIVANQTTNQSGSSSRGGGIFVFGNAHVTNTIISGNTGSQNPDCQAPLSGGSNIVGTNNNAGGCTGGSNLITLKGSLATVVMPLSNNGGFVAGAPNFNLKILTHALPPTSPAINQGDNTTTMGLATDQRGPGFPRINNIRVDMGSFEAF